MPNFILKPEELQKQADEFRKLAQTQEEKALLGRLDDEFNRRVNNRKPKDAQWLLNLAFFRGDQYSTMDAMTGRVIDLRGMYKDRSRIVCNLILGAVNDTLATLCQSDQQIEIIPASGSEKDIDNAKTCQIHLDRIDTLNHRRLLDIALRWNMLLFCRGYRLVFYDFTRGEGDPMADPIPLKWKGGEMQRRTGEVSELVLNPFELLFDYPAVQDDCDVTNFMRFRVMPIDWVRNNYEQGKFVEAEQNVGGVILSKYYNSVAGVTGDSNPSNMVVFKEYYEAATTGYPQGRLIQWANGVKLHEGVLSHPKGELGLFGYRWSIDTNDYYNISYVEPLIGPQKDLNRFKNKIQRWMDKIVRFRLAVPKGAKIVKSQLTGADDGDIMEFNPIGGVGVTHIPVPELPQSLFRGLENAFLTFDRVAHLHEISRGQVPGRVDSGNAIGRLQEAETRNLVVPMIHWEEKDCEVARFKLDLMRHYYPNEKGKEAKIIGEMRSVEVYSLRGVDVAANIDVKIIKGSAMPKSRMAQNAWTLELYKAGLLGPVNHPMVIKKVQSLLGFTGQSDVYGDVDINVNQQKEENVRLDKGEDVPVEKWHDHYVSNLIILKTMQSVTFKDKPKKVRAAYVRHWEAHAQYILAMNQAPVPEAVMGTLQTPGAQPSPGVAQLTGQGQFPGSPGGIPQQNPLQNIDLSGVE